MLYEVIVKVVVPKIKTDNVVVSVFTVAEGVSQVDPDLKVLLSVKSVRQKTCAFPHFHPSSHQSEWFGFYNHYTI